MSSPTVLISYSHKDKEWVRNWLLPRLEENGIKVIIDYRDFEIGVPSIINMERAVERSDRTLLVLTPNWVASEWTNFEALVLQSSDPIGLKGSIIPLKLKECTLPKRLSIFTYADFKNPDNWATEFSRLISQITGKPATAPEPTIDVTPPERISLAKMPSTNPELFGRDKELEMLDKAWENPQTNIISLIAFGGVGKTALVSNWLRCVRDDGWRGAERVLGWSFYSQGAAEGKQVSADQFIAFALDWFGDEDPTKGSPWDKGERLAELVKKHRTLLILDGLEPLQSPTENGCIKDPGLQCLLKELANQNLGLCVITTRLVVDDLKPFVDSSVERKDLEELSPEAGGQLLRHLGVSNATNEEFEEAVTEFGGHALAIELLGRLLAVAFEGDIRRRDKIPRLMIEEEKGGHARRVMEWYEGSFKGRPELDILYIMGLFDRPAEGGAIKALREEPAIKGLTAKLQNLSDIDWKYALKTLRDARLLAREDSNDPDELDCHPLAREHFGEKLQKNNPEAWKEAHSRLYEYFKSVPEKELPDTIEEMAPLYAAVGHGCQAGWYQEAYDEVYRRRTLRWNEFYSTNKLGAFGADLAALSNFFVVPWHEPVAALSDHDRMVVLGWAGTRLRALGRLSEAVQPMVMSHEGANKSENWMNASINAGNISELQLTMGNLAQALTYARQSVEHADRSGDKMELVINLTIVADTLHQLGRMEEAETIFKEAEDMQKKGYQEYPLLYQEHPLLLYSVQGFQYCDLLLSQGKHQEALTRLAQILEWANISPRVSLLDNALIHLALYSACFVKSQAQQSNDFSKAGNYLNMAVDGLREAGTQHHIPRGLLARAELYRVQKEFSKAERDVNEAMTIATRGGMRLHEADCHLEYARLYLAMGEKAKARESLETAAQMIEEMEYHRRNPEVRLAYAHLHIIEGNKNKAREHVATAQKMIDEMGLHRWAKDAADLAEELA